jgi:hypothetical protein
MPNGVAVALPLELDPPAPVRHAASTEAERSIGEAMADAAVMIHVGVEDGMAQDCYKIGNHGVGLPELLAIGGCSMADPLSRLAKIARERSPLY